MKHRHDFNSWDAWRDYKMGMEKAMWDMMVRGSPLFEVDWKEPACDSSDDLKRLDKRMKEVSDEVNKSIIDDYVSDDRISPKGIPGHDVIPEGLMRYWYGTSTGNPYGKGITDMINDANENGYMVKTYDKNFKPSTVPNSLEAWLHSDASTKWLCEVVDMDMLKDVMNILKEVSLDA